MKQVACSYGRAFLYIALSVVAAVVVAHFLNVRRLSFLSEDFVHWMQVLTASLFAGATLGRCGSDIQTWGKDTDAETRDTMIFRSLYLIGFALLVFSFRIRPV
jgi:hypothetical protein